MLQGVSLCRELSPSILPVLSPKQDRLALSLVPFCLSLPVMDRLPCLLGPGRPREYYLPGGWQAVACPSQLFARCLLHPQGER